MIGGPYRGPQQRRRLRQQSFPTPWLALPNVIEPFDLQRAHRFGRGLFNHLGWCFARRNAERGKNLFDLAAGVMDQIFVADEQPRQPGRSGERGAQVALPEGEPERQGKAVARRERPGDGEGRPLDDHADRRPEHPAPERKRETEAGILDRPGPPRPCREGSLRAC